MTIDIPQSDVVPVMDGMCDPIEYSDARQVNLYMSNTFSFPIFFKHSATDAYFCFGGPAGLPLPNGGLTHVVVYVDPLHDGDIYGSNADDFRVEMPYDPQDLPAAALWGTGLWNGADPGGWQAVKYQTPDPSAFWQVEFKISRETLGGWKHPVGLALFYHWWQKEGDDYSWPEYGIWANAKRYGNGNLITGTIDIGNTATNYTVDGLCDNEYADAASNSFSIASQAVTSYYEHSGTDLYVCIKNLPVPDLTLQNQPNAAVYLTRFGKGGGSPSPNDIAFTIAYDGTIQVGSGIDGGYTGPVPNGYEIARSTYGGGWDAEFRINSTVIGNWWDRSIGLTVAVQNMSTLADYYGWPKGSSATVPNSWGIGNLINLAPPPHIYLPILYREQ